MGLGSQVGRAMRALAACDIAPEVLARAVGLCVVTEVKAALMVSANVGRGIVVKRLSRAGWGFPSSVVCFGLGVGAQAGAEAIDVVLVILNAETMRAFEGSVQFRLGGEFSVAVGPEGKDGQAFGAIGDGGVASCLAYSASRGAFAGVSLEGSFFAQNLLANKKFYTSRPSVRDILDGKCMVRGSGLNHVEELQVFLFGLTQGQIGRAGKANQKLMPLSDDAFAQVEQSSSAFETREASFRAAADAHLKQGTPPEALRLQRFESEETICTEEEDDDEDDDDGDEDEERLDKDANPFGEMPATPMLVAVERCSIMLGQRVNQEWLRKRLCTGLKCKLVYDHVVDERDPASARHLIVSLHKGSRVVVVDGTIESGSATPYEDYCVVYCLDSQVAGRVSRFCLGPSSN